jgi:glycosyltransferase involved in cell wall biosynthesis
MRIGLGIFSSASAGMAIGPVDTALGLDALGADVTIFAEPGLELPRRARHLAGRVVPLAGPVRQLPPRVSDALFLPSKLGLGRRWADAIRDHPVDVVHAFSPGTAARLPAELTVVVQAWYHPARATLRSRLRRESAYGTGSMGASLPGPMRVPMQIAAHVARQAQTQASDTLGYRRSDLLLTATPSAARFYEQRGRLAACIPPCIAVAPATTPRATGEAYRIAFCAHPLDRPWKGLRYLLEALPAVPGGRPLELTLIGGWGKPPGALLEAVERAGVRVEVTGLVDRDVYLDRLAGQADVLVAPALWEEWGYSLFEGLSRGVPVIAFDHYPYAETLDASLGALVPPRDTAALTQALADARDGKLPTREQVLERTRERFGPEAIAARLLLAYETAQRSRISAGRANCG